MLFLLLCLLLLATAAFLALRRDRRSLLLFLDAALLSVFILGIMTFIAKRGGITKETSFIIFGPRALRDYLQMKVMTLGQLGYFVALGRFLFPPVLLLTAIDFSYFPLAVRLKRKGWALFILPLLLLVLYYPAFFKRFVMPDLARMSFVVYSARFIVYAYIALTALTLVYEYFNITNSFFRRRFLTKMSMLFSFGVVFSMYAHQDPAQVYLFYSESAFMMDLGLWYLSAGFTVPTYILVIFGSLLGAVIGFAGTVKYMRLILDEQLEEVRLRRKADDAAVGISAFMHGTKNEILSSRILISRLRRQGVESEDLDELEAVSNKLLERMNKLYAAVRDEKVHLTPVRLKDVMLGALERLEKSYPEARAVIDSAEGEIMVLADQDRLSEALANILINGWEAEKGIGSSEPLRVAIRLERLWVTVTVSDKGPGLDREAAKHLWEPFYSGKNSSSNWGMGMYFTRRMIQLHLGSVRFETVKGEGTKFIVLLPRYGRNYVPFADSR